MKNFSQNYFFFVLFLYINWIKLFCGILNLNKKLKRLAKLLICRSDHSIRLFLFPSVNLSIFLIIQMKNKNKNKTKKTTTTNA
jgi:hypothetical protein